MSFTESTQETGGSTILEPFGLPHEWQLLQSKQCPRCGYQLEEFAHANRWTCYECGVKIPQPTMDGNGRKYFIGLTKFKDETPF